MRHHCLQCMGGIGGRRGKAWRSAPLIHISRRLSRHEYLQQSLRRLLAHRALETTAWNFCRLRLAKALCEDQSRSLQPVSLSRSMFGASSASFARICKYFSFPLSSFILLWRSAKKTRIVSLYCMHVDNAVSACFARWSEIF